MSDGTFVIERIVKAPVSKVWKAITDKDEMKQWYFDIAAFKPQVGFEFHFEGKTPDGSVFVHKCSITEAIPNKKLAHTWQYEGYQGLSTVTYELFEEGQSTKVKLTHEGLDTFPKESNFAKENFVAGWTYIIGTSLANFVTKE
ncbi:SRPBCC family protein [Ferruginibacter albus]|uniref:SRPBCC family protein n=1 Tax=Ferruginibacter albus TaxID=2875540 RepID=UPI001CC512D9|nr:SRPBCC domain-containing protein [Ferruginibacter albus]UAY50985.1 SRPBCC domain-containing protein [Ferruginibacter albus]